MVRANEAPVVNVTVGRPAGLTAAVVGAVVAVDQGTGRVRYAPELFSTAKGGLVSLDGCTGQFVYTPSEQARKLARTSSDPVAKADAFTVTVTDLSGRTTVVPISVEILAAKLAPKAVARIRRPDVHGAVRGRIEATACDGGNLNYTLVNSSNPAGSTAESAYSEKRGLVQLDTETGHFVFIPAVSDAVVPGLDTDRFVVTVIDSQGGTADVTVKTLAHLAVDAQTTSTAPNTQCGRLSISGAEDGPLRFSLGRPPQKGAVQVASNGTYIYTRRPGLSLRVAAADSFTVTGTDHYGRSLTVATISVCPPLANTLPAGATAEVAASLNSAGEQITRGRIAAIDSTGSPLIFNGGCFTTAKGSRVSVEADGTYVYSSAGNAGVGHRAAAVDAMAADKVDSFTVTAANWLGRASEVVVRVNLLPHNSTPVVGTVGGSGRKRAEATGEWTTTVSDADGDAISYRVIQDNPWGTVSVRRNEQGAFVIRYTSTSPKVGRFHPGETFAVRFYDGHVASDGSPAYVTTMYAF